MVEFQFDLVFAVVNLSPTFSLTTDLKMIWKPWNFSWWSFHSFCEKRTNQKTTSSEQVKSRRDRIMQKWYCNSRTTDSYTFPTHDVVTLHQTSTHNNNKTTIIIRENVWCLMSRSHTWSGIREDIIKRRCYVIGKFLSSLQDWNLFLFPCWLSILKKKSKRHEVFFFRLF